MTLAHTHRVVSVEKIFIALVAIVLSIAPAAAACGDGVIDAGEDCDDGSANGTANSCCTAGTCKFANKAPDVIVGDMPDSSTYAAVGNIVAYSVGTTSCNLGSCWLNWKSGIAEHPVIGQNLFRLKNGRFEQVGQSWLKHGFTALQGTVCSTSCNAAPDGTHLGVNCSDPYSSSLNGSQTRLGPKLDVNPDTGVYLFPDSRETRAGASSIDKRLQAHTADVDPAQNSGAVYYAETQYVTHDDAMFKNNANNSSYRTCTFGAGPSYTMTLTGSVVRQKTGIDAWKAADATVVETQIGASEGLFILGAKVTSLGGGLYHYEYAVQNFTNNRGAQAFTVPLPPGTTVTNVGFHDVDYASSVPAEIYDGTDWTPTVTAGSVSWTTTPYATNTMANALRWGTLYNFRFDANQPPGTSTISLDYFKPSTPPGGPSSISASTLTPGVCGGAANGTACSDNSACTVGDACSSGACVPGSPVVCTPSDQCHDAGVCQPATGACTSPAKVNGSPCNDGNACTQTDTCQSGACTGANPVVCTAHDQCHQAGTCNTSTGACSNPVAFDGTLCNDNNACTQTDTCQSGVCIGASPVICTASDACHQPGTCNSATGACSSPAAPNGTPCNDGALCTSPDTCQGGTCTGTPVVCTPSDECHLAGTCDGATGACSNPAAADGTSCNDGNVCTANDACVSGACQPGNPITCAPIDQCHDAGTCDSSAGCSNPSLPDGTTCDDANVCTTGDVCTGGVCSGVGAPPPAEVDNGVTVTMAAGVATIAWDAAPGSLWSAVLRGRVSQLPVGPGGADEICIDNGTSSNQSTDADDPGAGDAFWYLVQGGNNCGRGTFGSQETNGVPTVPRTSATCP